MGNVLVLDGDMASRILGFQSPLGLNEDSRIPEGGRNPRAGDCFGAIFYNPGWSVADLQNCRAAKRTFRATTVDQQLEFEVPTPGYYYVLFNPEWTRDKDKAEVHRLAKHQGPWLPAPVAITLAGVLVHRALNVNPMVMCTLRCKEQTTSDSSVALISLEDREIQDHRCQLITAPDRQNREIWTAVCTSISA